MKKNISLNYYKNKKIKELKKENYNLKIMIIYLLCEIISFKPSFDYKNYIHKDFIYRVPSNME